MRSSMALFIILLTTSSISVQSQELATIPLKISDFTVSAEVAHTQSTRAQGLMYRKSLEENNGMLFVFPHVGYYSMWMLNTYIPLSVAFIDGKGIILNIADMKPHSQTAHQSAGVAKYALEMNLGWFAARKIQAGEKIIGLEQAPIAN